MPRSDVDLYGPHKLTNAAATLFTSVAASAGQQVITSIHFDNTDSSARTVTLSIGADAVDLEEFSGLSIPANQTYDWNGKIVLPASTTIQGFASVTNVVTVTITGVLETAG